MRQAGEPYPEGRQASDGRMPRKPTEQQQGEMRENLGLAAPVCRYQMRVKIPASRRTWKNSMQVVHTAACRRTRGG